MIKTETEPSGCEPVLSWAIVGASGFVGNGICAALDEIETGQVKSVSAPRLQCMSISDDHSALEMVNNSKKFRDVVADLVPIFEGFDIVINAAGLASPDASDTSSLIGANALLPLVIAEASERAQVSKFIHISSAAVQGDRKILDESADVNPFSEYSRSKALGEQALALWNDTQRKRNNGQLRVVTVRATSVQGLGRQTTTTLKRIARSPLASIAKPGDQPTVVSSLPGLSKFVVIVGTSSQQLPQILIQPWEGASVLDIMLLAGEGRSPKMIPASIARSGVTCLKLLGLMNARFKGLARRLEVMWFGQRQVAGWAVESGLVAKNAQGPTASLRRVLAEPGAPHGEI